MKNNDIEGIQIAIQNIHDKMKHAFKVHLKVAEDRRNIIVAIDKLNFVGTGNPKTDKVRMEELMGELEKCHENERRVIAITEPE